MAQSSTLVESTAITVVGTSGQISLGKRYAGKTLRIERRRDGTLVLTAVAVVPENQHWTLKGPDRSRISRGLTWAAATPTKETDIDQWLKKPSVRSGHTRGRPPVIRFVWTE